MSHSFVADQVRGTECIAKREAETPPARCDTVGGQKHMTILDTRQLRDVLQIKAALERDVSTTKVEVGFCLSSRRSPASTANKDLH